MKEIIPPRYDIKEVEERIYKLWEKSGVFSPNKLKLPKNAKTFSIVLPPPNVTGELHMGHAAMIAIEDIMIRYARMKGMRTLWLPGTDHAAIATQSRVEKDIYKKEGKNRHDLGREDFLRRVEDFASKSHDYIVHQIKRMGASLDWSREAFTLDEKRSLSVREAFKRMYEAGLVYRGERIVNWDPKMQTTVSDDEIEWIEEKSPFYYLKYGPFEIATARPETKFGDKYVVVHPDDPRYKKYKHGEKLEVNWINGKIMATVIKNKAVDMKFGTGAMTITPSHDNADFEIAERHKLDREQIIDNYGKLLPIAGEFAGMKIKEARPKIVEKLKAKGLLARVDENYVHRVATSSRGGGVIEPQVMKQWFVDVNRKVALSHSNLKGIKSGAKKSLKDLMNQAVKSGEIEIMPERFKKIYFHWINNLRDWCISRQIWYGHRIPVWYCLKCGDTKVEPKIKSRWFLVRHGETDWNKEFRIMGQEDVPLNATGNRQAEDIAEQLGYSNIDLVITSDLLRSRQTAEIIAKRAGAELIIDKDLRERNVGEWQGLSKKEIDEKHGRDFWEMWRNYDFNIPQAESWAEVEKRVWEAFKHHQANHKHKNVVVVTHGGSLRMIRKRIMEVDPGAAMSLPLIDNAGYIKLDISDKCRKCGGDLYEQDSDTLDTWFSSGLWTFSTLGWPNKSKNLKTFHPMSVLETGYDILFFWVARMILMTTYLLGEVPFRKVYLHGLVRDMQGRKMSKTLGNGIDPLLMADKYGADAARLSLIIGTGPGNDIKLSEDKIRGYRNFATKIWNATRFVMMSRKSEFKKIRTTLSPADKKDLAQLKKIKTEVTKHLEKYEFHLAGEKLYHYFWHEFADKIIEAAKPRLSGKDSKDAAAAYTKLETILMECLKMLHPFIPFVTEEIWQKMGNKNLLMIERWPR